MQLMFRERVSSTKIHISQIRYARRLAKQSRAMAVNYGMSAIQIAQASLAVWISMLVFFMSMNEHTRLLLALFF